MNLEQWTESARQTLAQAQVLAREMKHQEIDLPHMLAVMLRDPDGLAARILSEAGADVEALSAQVHRELGQKPRVDGVAGGTHLSARMHQVIEEAEKTAQAWGDRFVAQDVLLLAMARAGYPGLPGDEALKAVIQKSEEVEKWKANTAKAHLKRSSAMASI